jgi:PAS domain S-box-containing protein
MSPRSNMAIARRLRRRIDEMALDGTLTALAAHHPPTPVSGALRLAQTLRERYELRIAYIVLASVLLVLVAGLFSLLRQRRIHAALRTSETRYRLMVEANPVGFIHAALGGPGYGRLHHVNQAFLDMTGFSRAELESGKVSLASLTPREWFPADARAVEEARRYGRSKLYEKEYVRKDGTRVPLLAACAALDERDAVAFAIDISERRRLERQVKWLSGMVPICAACKRIRNEEGQWQELESYMITRISADFSHGICPACLPLYDL